MPMPSSGGPHPGAAREVLFEIQAVGRFLRITAIDPLTGTEVVAVGPTGGEEALRLVAMQKLARALDRKRGGSVGC
jgi:hypothetical protein